MAAEDEGFLGRWSRRKVQERSGQAGAEAASAIKEPKAQDDVQAPLIGVGAADATAPLTPQEQHRTEGKQQAQAQPLPTLDDVQALTPDADFSRFVARGVSPDVRNAAVKKLFTDPHYNVMDGLDIYIDDYSLPNTLPAAALARMVSAQFMKLVDDPAEEKPDAPAKHLAPASEDTVVPALAQDQTPAVSESAASTDLAGATKKDNRESPNDDPDLQLQPDHAPGPRRAGPVAG